MKKYTVRQLMEKYWKFRLVIITEHVPYQSFTGSGNGGYDKVVYKDNAQDFLLWLKENE